MLPPGYIEQKYKKQNNIQLANNYDAVGFSNAVSEMNTLINKRCFNEAREMLKVIESCGAPTERWALKIDNAEDKYIESEKFRRGRIQLARLRNLGYSEEHINKMSMSTPNLKLALDFEANKKENESLQKNNDKQVIKKEKVKQVNQQQFYK